MKIVYSCYGGAHSSPVAAAIHLGLLPPGEVPTATQLMKIPYYERVTAQLRGQLLFCGEDNFGHQVYVLGRGSASLEMMEKAILAGYRLGGGRKEDFIFIDTLPYVNSYMRLGGFLSRALGLVAWGRPVVIKGTQRAYPHLVRLVREIWAQIDQDGRKLGIESEFSLQ